MLIEFQSKNVPKGQYELCKAEYMAGGPTALTLCDSDGDVIRLTTCIPDATPHLMPFDVVLKDWMENEGVIEGLLEAGIVDTLKAEYPAGHAKVKVYGG